MSKIITKKNIYLFFLASVLLIPLFTGHAYAQAIDELAEQSTNRFNKAFGYGLNSFCFIVGGTLLAVGVMSLYQKHKNNNAGTSMSKIVSALAVGAILVGFPFLVKTASFSFWGANTSVTGEQRMMMFDK